MTKAPTNLVLKLTFSEAAREQYQSFMQSQITAHINSDCEFPGYEFVIGHLPALNDWDLRVVVGSQSQEINGVTFYLGEA